jgi:hypothetical protein
MEEPIPAEAAPRPLRLLLLLLSGASALQMDLERRNDALSIHRRVALTLTPWEDLTALVRLRVALQLVWLKTSASMARSAVTCLNSTLGCD